MSLTRVQPLTSSFLPKVDGSTLSQINNSLKKDPVLSHDQLKQYYAAVIWTIEKNHTPPVFYNYNVVNRWCNTACMMVCCIPCCLNKILMIPLKCCCWKNRCVDCMDDCSGECIIDAYDRVWSKKEIKWSNMKTMAIEVICELVHKLVLIIKESKNDQQIYNAMVKLSDIYEQKSGLMFVDVRLGKTEDIITRIMTKFNNIPGFTENYNNYFTI